MTAEYVEAGVKQGGADDERGFARGLSFSRHSCLADHHRLIVTVQLR